MRALQSIPKAVLSRISILIKSAEIIIRDGEKMKRNDIIYYLEQIIKEAEDCLSLMDAPRVFPQLKDPNVREDKV